MQDNILVGLIPPPYSGLSVAFQMLIDGFEEQGLSYQVVDISPRAKDRIWGKWSWGRFWEYLRILLKYFYTVSGSKKNIYITIAQSRVGFLRDLLMIWFARFGRHRIVVHLHGGNYDGFYATQPCWLKWLIRATLRQTDAVLVLGERLRKMYDFEPALKNRIHVVPNGLPFKLDNLSQSAKEIKEGEPIRLLYLSNLIESKGYLDVLEAIQILVKEHGLKVECRFCGSFSQNVADDVRVRSAEHGKQLFMDFVSEHNLDNCIEYVGFVSGKTKQEELKRAHLFVLPTNYKNEGQPISIIEAMAYGCVLVSTRYRAIPDMLIDGKNGYFVEYGKPEQIAQALINASQNPDKFHQMSNYSIAHFKKHFTRKAHLDRIIPLITGS